MCIYIDMYTSKQHFFFPFPRELPIGRFFRGMGINGFGRIGRLVFRAASGNPDAEAHGVAGGTGGVGCDWDSPTKLNCMYT